MMDYEWPQKEKCRVAVYVRDTYRRTGRGRSGFEMHYNRQQCSRKPVEQGYCRQHFKMAKEYGLIKDDQ